MTVTIDAFSDTLLDQLVGTVFEQVPSVKATFLSSLGRRVHRATLRVLYGTLQVEDDNHLFTPLGFHDALGTILLNPAAYASFVKKLVVHDPRFSEEASLDSLANSRAYAPIHAENMERLLSVLVNLEDLTWHSSVCPPNALCEMLSYHNVRLNSFSYHPSSSHISSGKCLRKWDAASLPLLSALPIRNLSLASLSQIGSRALVHLLERLDPESPLDALDLDLVWLDDSVCQAIADSSARIRQLRLSTSGTKLTDTGLEAILLKCESLEYLSMDEVQGRLSRNLWSNFDLLPPSFKGLTVKVAESGPRHSWSVDHLLALGKLPFANLEEFSIVRKECRYVHGAPFFNPQCQTTLLDDVVALKPLPHAIKETITSEKRPSLRKLRLDFWMCSFSDLKAIIESCPRLEFLQVCLDAPFSKLLGMASSFANLANLTCLRVAVSPAHSGGTPPVPLPPHAASSRSSIPTPCASPVVESRSFDSHLDISTDADLTDPALPQIRDVKKFVRRCPKLQSLEWFGKLARGSWTAHRPGAANLKASKACKNVAVVYEPPVFSEDAWRAVTDRRDAVEDVPLWYEIERSGHAWAGEIAEELSVKYDKECAERHTRRMSKQKGGQTSSSLSIDSAATSGCQPSSSPSQPLTPPRSSASSLSDDSGLKSIIELSPLPIEKRVGKGNGRRRSSSGMMSENNKEKKGDQAKTRNGRRGGGGQRTKSMSGTHPGSAKGNFRSAQ